ncbi:MAG: ADP-ribosylglycohydrolase family protein [Nitrosomonas sp.]|nr:ADP-ribosylglycohydrolase family protein [Nitrosomonas sp.]
MGIHFNNKESIVLGALVADAASLGLHWLYDVNRIHEIEQRKGLVFLQPDAEYYADGKGYYAHGNKCAGETSAYGDTCLLMLRHLADHGQFDLQAYQKAYCTYFGPGGKYIGYVDSPTRFTLAVLLAAKNNDYPGRSGADDSQHPALATIPALVAAHRGSKEALLATVDTAVRITNNNDIAVSGARCLAIILYSLLAGEPLQAALRNGIAYTEDTLATQLEEALAMNELPAATVAEKFGRACHIQEGLPIVFHIARHAENYKSAIQDNIRAGGDSCGRAIALGAIMAISASSDSESIPLSWLVRYARLAETADALEDLL